MLVTTVVLPNLNVWCFFAVTDLTCTILQGNRLDHFLQANFAMEVCSSVPFIITVSYLWNGRH